ncbi:MAG: fibrobacter succinogenes major paralogous domain-containing protein [Bacteroidales bacterium]
MSSSSLQQNLILVFSCLVFTALISVSCGKDKDSTPSDGDGNTYKTVVTGSQSWLSENLKPTKYNDGTDIPLITDNGAWYLGKAPGYCWYENKAAENKDLFGALYNWYAVNTGKLCPKGWHVPTDKEWMQLEEHLGMVEAEQVFLGWRGEDKAIGGMLKSTGTSLWTDPNTGATNSTGFEGYPGGCRILYGDFKFKFGYAYWWCSGEVDQTYGIMRSLASDLVTIFKSHYQKEYGMSVRCVKDL